MRMGACRGISRRGFTLIELLVSIAVVAVLLCLSVLIVQSRRESARSARCVNNLKRIGMALAHYESSHKAFPPGAVLYNPGDAETQCGNLDDVRYGNPRDFTAFTLILGQMDQDAAYNAINFSLRAGGGNDPYPDGGASNFTALSIPVAAYICPSDSQTIPGRTRNAYSQTSYFPSGGTWNTMAYSSGPECWNQNKGNGAFDTDTSYARADFKDGTAHTIAVGEASRFLNDPDPQFNQWSRFGYFTSSIDPSLQTTRPQGLAYEVAQLNADLYAFDYAQLPPGTLFPDDSDTKAWLKNLPLYKGFGQWGFRSHHPGGANFLYADGSVRFTKNSIDLQTYQALGTRDGGEAISKGTY